MKAPALGLLAAMALAAGCGPRADGPRTTLRFWAMGREGEVVQELVRDFERENPTLRVQVQQIPWSAAHEKLLTAYVGNATPDVCQLGNTWIAEFAALAQAVGDEALRLEVNLRRASALASSRTQSTISPRTSRTSS